MPMKLSYDGKGINDLGDKYAPRVATFTGPDDGERFGSLFAASPSMLEALESVLGILTTRREELYEASKDETSTRITYDRIADVRLEVIAAILSAKGD